MRKPNIDAVCLAFHAFQAAAVRANYQSGGLHQPAKWEATMGIAREELRVALDKLGLAQHIDWTVSGK